MAKKKRTALKPVARGFATTSIPSKKTVIEDETASIAESTDTCVTNAETESSVTAVSKPPSEHEFDAEKVEEQSLQNLVEKLQEKTEKEVVRTIKIIEYDRRFSKSLPRLELDPILRDRVLRMVLETEQHVKALVEDSEDKVLPRLGITYGVLRRLGFSEERVTECLTAIPSVELEEAFEWLYLHCPEEELAIDKEAEVQEPKTPRTPRTPFSFQNVPPTPSPLSDAKQQQPPLPSQRTSLPKNSIASEDAALKSRILAYSNLSSEASSDQESVDYDPNAEYAQAKLKLVMRHLLSEEEIAILEDRLSKAKAHYFFAQKDADALYRAEKTKADATALESRLKSSLNGTTESPKRRPPKLKPQPPSPPTPSVVVDVLDESGGNGEVGFFGHMLDEMPTNETSGDGTLVHIRDMSLPKHFAGRTPKVLLQETVSKTDRYAAITYRAISGSSRACRASVSVRGGKTKEWSMVDVGCHDALQAEQYIATVALHSLTFPESEGFAGGSGSSTVQTYFRLLPPVFRDLWDELEVKRKLAEDATNRSIWSKLRAILESKLKASNKAGTKTAKELVGSSEAARNRNAGNGHELSSEQLIAGFRARQASPAYQEMLAARRLLPIAQYREQIISTLETSQILVLSGETGCGKSTQLPAFILEDQLSRGIPCKIYCTEPRRISAISLAQRVSRELGDPPNAVGTNASLVGYSIRLESHTSRNTRLAYVTNGIALRMLEGGSGNGGQGTAFDEITHIIIDEVHERTIESDFLLIVLKSLLGQRKDLKIILMSATVDADKISAFFGGCPTLHIPGRTFPVDVRYLEDALEFTGWSITETSPYAKRLNDKFHRQGKNKEWSEETATVEDDDEISSDDAPTKLEKKYSPLTVSTINLLDERLIPYDLIIRLLERLCFEEEAYISFSAAILIFMPGIAEIRRLNDMLTEHPHFGSSQAFRLYPLHSTISSENQGAVFDIPPVGVRKIVISTNIAETGITIPDVTCVIDTGKHREMRFDEKRQISRLVETYIAKSNAAQRRGRAGRVQSGLCFHLFTKARHDNQMAENPLPEMMRLSLSDLALRIKIMKVKIGTSIEDVLSRALDPPLQSNVQRAVSSLVEVKALTPSEDITPMGRLLSKLPTDVHLGKFILIATLFRCLDPALTIAATLNAKSPFLIPFGYEQEADRAKLSFKIENSDFLTIHNAFSSWRRASANGNIRAFCRQNYLSHQNLQQIEELRQQFLSYLIDAQFIQVDRAFERELSRARFGRHRNTRFVTVPPELNVNSGDNSLINAALAAGLWPKVLQITNDQMKTVSNNQPAAFHPTSINFNRSPRDFGVNHLCYFTIMHSKKLYAWETGPVDDLALVLLCGDCDFKLNSESLFIDRKIKFRSNPKANIALKYLRENLNAILAQQMRGKPLTESQERWNEVALAVIGRTKLALQDDDKKEAAMVISA